MKNSVARTQPVKTYAHEPRADKLPLAIGANFHDDPINRSTLRKSHNLMLDRKVDHAPHASYTYTGSGGRMCASTGSGPGGSAADACNEDPNVWEGWFTENISAEDQKDFVVCMLAYFTEKLPERDVDEECIRTVCIKYYVRDKSVTITEAKQENSGIVQGELLSRRQVPRSTNSQEVLQLEDFKIGSPVVIYGREYNIVDMDQRSRKYFADCRRETLPAALEVPVDGHSATVAASAQRSTTRAITSDDMDNKRNAEQQLTGIYTKHPNEDLAITQRFLKNAINEHLTFLALWDDRGSICGDLRHCIIRLYLENCAVEVVEKRHENSGRFGSPVLVSRQRIPRAGVALTDTRHQEHTYGKLMRSDYLCPEDFQIGETYHIFGKPFYVFDADAPTRKHMKENYGVELKEAVDVKPFIAADKKAPVFYPPPPNGFGSEREQRANWLSLTVKAAQQDFEKVRQEAGRVMNFAARLARPRTKDDEAREFVISFYRETAEVEINEKPRRNSGLVAGRFLAKGKHRKTLPNGITMPFEPSDFVVGAEVTIFGRSFFLIEADEGTKRIMAGLDTVTTEDAIKQLVVLLKQQIRLRFTKASNAYGALAPQGTLGFRQVKEFLRSCSCNVSDSDAILVVQNLWPDSDGIVSFESFQRLFNLIEEYMDEASFTTRSVRNVSMTVNDSMKHAASASEDRQLCRRLKTLLQQKLMQRAGSLQETFRSLSEHCSNSRMNREAFRRALNSSLYINMGPKEDDMLVAMLFDGVQDENGDITYKQFQDFVDSK